MFLGRVPAERHITRVYDSGRVTVTEVEREPLWTDDDRAWAVALLVEEAEECSGCGVPISEAHDPTREFTEDETAYYWSSPAVMCNACAARDRAARKAREDFAETPEAFDGLMWGLKRTE